MKASVYEATAGSSSMMCDVQQQKSAACTRRCSREGQRAHVLDFIVSSDYRNRKWGNNADLQGDDSRNRKVTW